MSIGNLLRRILYRIPTQIRFLIYPVRYLISIFNRVRLDQWILMNKEGSNKEKLTVIYTGQEKSKNYFIKLAYNNICKEHYIGKRWIWNFNHTTKKMAKNVSLTVTEVHESLKKYFKEKNLFYVPCWISTEIDITGEMSSIINNRGLKSDLSHIRKSKLHYELTNEVNSFKKFYYNMYVPSTKKLHGNQAVIHNYDSMKEIFSKNCDLLLLKKGQEYIAGILIYYMNGKARLWSSGLNNGNIDYIRKYRAKGALYYFSILCLKEKGIKKLSFGLTRAFLNDGVYQYKKKWGLYLLGTTNVGFLIKPLILTDGLKNFFMNNPFIHFGDDERYFGTIFVDNINQIKKEKIKKIYKNRYIHGLSQFLIYSFDETYDNKQDVVPHELLDKIEIRSVRNEFKELF